VSGFFSMGRRGSPEAREHTGRDLHGERALGSGQALASVVTWDSVGILESSENSPGNELGVCEVFACRCCVQILFGCFGLSRVNPEQEREKNFSQHE